MEQDHAQEGSFKAAELPGAASQHRQHNRNLSLEVEGKGRGPDDYI